MKRLKSSVVLGLKCVFVFCLISTLVFPLIFFFGAVPVGRMGARYDLWRGKYRIQGFGLLLGEPPWIHMLHLYGIEYRHVAGCIVNDFIIDEVAAYNEIMEKAVKKDIGIDIRQITGQRSSSGVKIKNLPRVMMETPIPADYNPNKYLIGPCFKTMMIDIDNDHTKEKICARYLHSKKKGDATIFRSLVFDIFKNRHQILRQELGRGLFFDERFESFSDIDSDGKKELVTQVRLSPNSSGCVAFRVYRFKKDTFELAFNLFNVNPDNPKFARLLNQNPQIEVLILQLYKKLCRTPYPCEIYDECEKTNLWFVGLEDNTMPAALFLADSPSRSSFKETRAFRLLLTQFAKSGKRTDFMLHKLGLKNPDGWIDLIGFLKTRDRKIHMLVNSNDPQTGPASPALNVFKVTDSSVDNIGTFTGFQTRNIPRLLQDFNGDGNTEIVYVEDTYWPPGEPHAGILPIYSIAEFKKGRYRDAKIEFKKQTKEMNALFK